MAGKLMVCPTPIGNLDDCTFRVVQALKEADFIAAEDTRHTRGLLNHFDIKKPMVSCHKFNETERVEAILARIAGGEVCALVSDAGTPAISDPGEILVREARKMGLAVTALPGPCALTTALSGAGRDTRRFVFEGFLPTQKKEREALLSQLKSETRTTVLYEAPHHLKETLKILYDTLGDRTITLARELTKIHEEYRTTSLKDALAYYETNEARGEYVLILDGVDRQALETEKTDAFSAMTFTEHMKRYAELPEKEAMKQVAKDRGMAKRDVYAELLKEKGE